MSNELLVSNVVALVPRKTLRGDVVGRGGQIRGHGSPCRSNILYKQALVGVRG